MAGCEERLRLFVQYQESMQAYAEAVGSLAAVKYMPHDEHERLSQATEKAREESVAARERLDRHIAEHGC
jgi:hypothetical protein